MKRRLAMLLLLGVAVATMATMWIAPTPRVEPSPEWIQDASLGSLPRLGAGKQPTRFDH